MLKRTTTAPVLNSKKLSEQSRGFTIIEFLIALTIFSIMLVIIITTIDTFMNDYYKGITVSNTQTAINNISSSISQGIQLSSASNYVFDTSGNSGAICTGTEEFYYANLGQEYPAGGGLFYEFPNISGYCYLSSPTTPAQAASGWTERKSLLNDNMRLLTLQVTPVAANADETPWAQLYQMDVKIAYAAGGSTTDPGGDLLCSLSAPLGCSAQAPALTSYTVPNIQCRSNVGYQFCDVEELHSVIDQRLE